MTEASFQECRKLMQKANYMRGIITKREGEVAKWTRIEGSHREKMQESQANGADKMIKKALERLAEARKKFTDLKFPDSDIAETVNRCKECGCRIAAGNNYCSECLCEDDMV